MTDWANSLVAHVSGAAAPDVAAPKSSPPAGGAVRPLDDGGEQPTVVQLRPTTDSKENR